MAAPRPTTADHLRFHALRAPDSIAIIEDGRAVTYERFVCELSAMRRELAALHLNVGDLAVVQCRNTVRHWLILLAFEALGIVTTSVSAVEAGDLLPLYPLAAILLTDSAAPAPTGLRIFRITEDWMRAALDTAPSPLPEDRPVAIDPAAPIRLVRTSGTTGTRKNLLRSRAMQDARYRLAFIHKDCSRASRYLFVPGFVVESAYFTATAVLRAGGTAIFEGRMTILDALALHRPDALDLLPIFLDRMTENLRPDFGRLPALTVYSTGGFVLPAIRERVLSRVAGRLEDIYGTNEVGPIGFMRADRTACLLPEVKVEIVDARDEPLPIGTEGRIRLRSPVMVDGYLGDADATARMFRGGWFYPGDLGMMTEPGRLRLLGRTDHLLNVGGLKITPEAVEEMLTAQPMIADAAVASRVDGHGLTELCLLLVDRGNSTDELVALVEQLLPPAWRIRVWRVDQIPRTATGKIARGRVKELVDTIRPSVPSEIAR